MKSTRESILMAMMAGCKKNELSPVEDNENLIAVKLKFTKSGTTSTFTFKNLDGAGGNAPTIDKISLKPNKTYKMVVEILETTTDKDTRGLPVGLTVSVKTSAAGTGKLQVVLYHQPPVNGKIVKNGTFKIGSIDFDGTYDVEVKYFFGNYIGRIERLGLRGDTSHG